MVSVLEDGIAQRHPALEPNYVSVLEEHDALWALIPANLAAPLAPERKRGERYFGLSNLGQRFGKGPPGLLVWTLNVWSNQLAGPLVANDEAETGSGWRLTLLSCRLSDPGSACQF